MPSTSPDAALTRLAVNTIKTLAIDAVEAAKSGHPGLPMGMADCAFELWTRHLRLAVFHQEVNSRDETGTDDRHDQCRGREI